MLVRLLTRLWGISGQTASGLTWIQIFWTHLSINLTLQDHPTCPLQRERQSPREREEWEGRMDNGKVSVMALVNGRELFVKLKKMNWKKTNVDGHTKTLTHLTILPILPWCSRSCKTCHMLHDATFREPEILHRLSPFNYTTSVNAKYTVAGPQRHQLQTAYSVQVYGKVTDSSLGLFSIHAVCYRV